MIDDEEYRRRTEEAERAIGKFILQFAGVELALQYVLCEVTELSLHWAKPVVTHDFALLCTAIETVFGEILEDDPDDRARLKKFIKRARAFNDVRVKTVHGFWYGFGFGGIVAHTSRQTLRPKDMEGMVKILADQTQAGRELFAEALELTEKCQKRLGIEWGAVSQAFSDRAERLGLFKSVRQNKNF
ncbi:hypothetical protein I6F20_16990 [Bradyrhizobium sp. IC3123]|uniref:hypothetical protein n=1 Tax=Bradyrhizobium sp. IC3123 TaxID=2793803 RepID=UPI001CD6F2D6|nr:hypothetical protein [Bradyrhizobium sp. IC3123]MCA1390764.1 hypothetical protein [Bradyrhizobium sp. IC3123]